LPVRPDFCFELARVISIKIDRAAAVVDETSGFAYRDSRDLIGFVDGTEDPEADERSISSRPRSTSSRAWPTRRPMPAPAPRAREQAKRRSGSAICAAATCSDPYPSLQSQGLILALIL
jgi:deferrochelatase/peroxidase EfeB